MSAGHPVPLLARPHRVGAVPLATVMYLLWGEYGDAPCTDRMLEAGDRLALYTGGITDRTEPRDTMEDSDRLHAALARTSSASPAQIVDALTAELDAFADVQEADDDQTLVVVGID